MIRAEADNRILNYAIYLTLVPILDILICVVHVQDSKMVCPFCKPKNLKFHESSGTLKRSFIRNLLPSEKMAFNE